MDTDTPLRRLLTLTHTQHLAHHLHPHQQCHHRQHPHQHHHHHHHRHRYHHQSRLFLCTGDVRNGTTAPGYVTLFFVTSPSSQRAPCGVRRQARGRAARGARRATRGAPAGAHIIIVFLFLIIPFLHVPVSPRRAGTSYYEFLRVSNIF